MLAFVPPNASGDAVREACLGHALRKRVAMREPPLHGLETCGCIHITQAFVYAFHKLCALCAGRWALEYACADPGQQRAEENQVDVRQYSREAQCEAHGVIIAALQLHDTDLVVQLLDAPPRQRVAVMGEGLDDRRTCDLQL